MKLWRWEHGRQNGGYSKFTLAFSKRLKFDAYIIRLPCTSMVPHHRDPAIEGYEHHRINITLRAASKGGVTYIDEAVNCPTTASGFWMRAPRAYHFRPDVQEHFVTAILKGEVWLLSFGWLRKSRT